jgi:hypothetical protein
MKDPQRIHEMDPAVFQKTYAVGVPYAPANWDTITDDEGFWEGPMIVHKGETDWTSDLNVLREHVAKHGIQDPVRVSAATGAVIDGHHRVHVARETGQPVRYRLV